MNSVIQPYDIVMLVVLLCTTIFGAWKGMAWQVASLASLLVSAGVAVHFSAPLAPYISATEPWNRFLAMFILYVLTSLAIWLLFRLVAGIIERVKLREFDRQMGALFGLIKGILLCVVLTFFAVTLSESLRQKVLISRSGDAIARITRHAGPLLPEDVRNVIGKYIDELDKKLDPNTPPSQPEEKNIGTDDLRDAGRVLEQKLNEAGRAIEALGRQTNQQFETLGSQATQQIESFNRQADQKLDPLGQQSPQPYTP
ncbi:MAG TPA: CvpA family protein [Thermoguttaceae bacterium]